MLPSLKTLCLYGNLITDQGCATLGSAHRGGALPALTMLALEENPASEAALDALRATLPPRVAVFH